MTLLERAYAVFIKDIHINTYQSSATLFNIENLILRARVEFNGFAGKDCELFWSTGILEYWSLGKSKSPNFNLNWFFHYSITPPHHYSRRLPQGGKTIEVPSGGSPKPGPLGPDSCFLLYCPRKGVRFLRNNLLPIDTNETEEKLGELHYRGGFSMDIRARIC